MRETDNDAATHDKRGSNDVGGCYAFTDFKNYDNFTEALEEHIKALIDILVSEKVYNQAEEEKKAKNKARYQASKKRRKQLDI